MKIYKGNILFTPSVHEFTLYQQGYLIEEEGKVKYTGVQLPEEYQKEQVTDFGDKLIIPGFNDVHVHAPQWCNAGIGFSMELLPWLNTYTFPAEAHFGDVEFAGKEYPRFVNELLKHGTTRACIFASRHLEATKVLIDTIAESGMGAYVGKVNMDRNAIPELQETTEDSLRETEELILWMKEKYGDTPKLNYILTPRYVPSTTSDLMDGLGKMSAEYHLPVQSHLDENRDEIAWVRQLHPESASFADVYEDHDLMPKGRTIMAHCIHMTEEEMALLKRKDVLIAHCAMSNADLASGIMPLRKYLDFGLNVAIASDMGGSHTVNMAEHIVDTIKASKIYWFYHPQDKAISFTEGFYLATKAGGSFFGKVGSFEEGYQFDALVIDDGRIRSGMEHSLLERLERFIYVGDSSCIEKRFVSGKECVYPIKEGKE